MVLLREKQMIDLPLPLIASATALYLICIWLITFLIFWLDKERSRTKNARRVPERTLLQLSLFGGWPAALLARHMLRHKTVKQPFSTYLDIIVVVEIMIIVGFSTYYLSSTQLR